MVHKKIRVALAGLGFGSEFIPIYLHHPQVESLTICDANPAVLEATGDKFEVIHCTTDLNSIINSEEFDAVHLVTPIPYHARQAIAVLQAGKHCACTVPIALSLDDLNAIVAAQSKSGRVYMGSEIALSLDLQYVDEKPADAYEIRISQFEHDSKTKKGIYDAGRWIPVCYRARQGQQN